MVKKQFVFFKCGGNNKTVCEPFQPSFSKRLHFSSDRKKSKKIFWRRPFSNCGQRRLKGQAESPNGDAFFNCLAPLKCCWASNYL